MTFTDHVITDPQDAHLLDEDRRRCEVVVVLETAEREGLLDRHFHTEGEASWLIGRDVPTLRRWRKEEAGPSFLALPGGVWYPIESLKVWCKGQAE